MSKMINLSSRNQRLKYCLLSPLWAGLLATILFSGCNKKQESKKEGQIQDQPKAVAEEFVLAKILVQPRDGIRVNRLKEGGQRVYGRTKTPFKHIGENLTGARFTQVKSQSTPTYDIKVTHDGYLYVLKGEDKDLEKTGRHWENYDQDLEGAWLHGVYRTKVKAGDELHLSWFELSFVAGDISIDKWLPKETE